MSKIAPPRSSSARVPKASSENIPPTRGAKPDDHAAPPDGVETPAEGDRRRAAARSVGLQANPSQISTNAVELQGPEVRRGERVGFVGPGAIADDVSRTQRRLNELLPPERRIAESGVYDAATRAALIDFQNTHSEDINQIRVDSRATDPRAGSAGRDLTTGQLRENDATHQALANAWPRTVNGRLMTEAQGYAYLAQSVERRMGRPLDESRVNVVGVRAYQGGGTHDNEGVGRANNQYNDTLFTLYRDGAGNPRVRETRATVDPGGHRPFTDHDDPAAMVVRADQQVNYLLSAHEVAAKGDRYGFYLRTGEGVLRDGSTHPDLLISQNGRDRNITENIMMHTGYGGQNVDTESMGCQVPHGSWYPNYVEGLRRELGRKHQSSLTYTLIDGRTLEAPGPSGD